MIRNKQHQLQLEEMAIDIYKKHFDASIIQTMFEYAYRMGVKEGKQLIGKKIIEFIGEEDC